MADDAWLLRQCATCGERLDLRNIPDPVQAAFDHVWSNHPQTIERAMTRAAAR